jgi:hypothetical protein
VSEVNEKLEGEFRAMKSIVKVLSEHIDNVTPEGRVWLRVKISEILGDQVPENKQRQQGDRS